MDRIVASAIILLLSVIAIPCASAAITIDLNASSANVTIYGDTEGDNSGVSVSSGDINGDGIGDVIIGAHYVDPAGMEMAGETYVIYGANDTGDLPVHNVNTNEDFETIQGAIDAPNTIGGHIIEVDPGTYNENVDVYKQLTIRSTSGDPSDTIVRANGADDHVFTVTVAYANISGFTITNEIEYQKAGIYLGDGVNHCNISANNVSNNAIGIQLNKSCSNTLQNNIASNNNVGILLSSSYSNTIMNNIVNMNKQTNIVMDSSSGNMLTNNTAMYSGNGIYLMASSGNTLTDNTASNNEYGICLYFSSCDNNLTNNIANANTGELGGILLSYESNNNTLTRNKASDNSQHGIYLRYSNRNTLTSNTVNSNSNYGIYLYLANNNLIYDNYFNNTNNAYDEGINIWNITPIPGTNIINGSWLGGNYWGDYTGEDEDGDGLGDTMRPYNSSDNIQQGGDWHPLVVPLPDLVITDTWLNWPNNCTICYNVTNKGTETASAAHNTSFYVDGVEVALDYVPEELTPGENYTGCFDDYIWAYTPPEDNITVCVDVNNTIAESNETNNCRTNTWMCGDVNEDHGVNVLDVLGVYRRALDPGYPLRLPWAADINGDGNINVLDLLGVYRKALDPGYDLECCCEQTRIE